MAGIIKISRREFLLAGAGSTAAGGAALILGFFVGRRYERKKLVYPVPPRPEAFAPNAFLAIDGDGSVTVWVTRSEMGQGVSTALPMLVAEELDADWATIRIEQALANPAYGDQATVASRSVSRLWGPLRKAGAAAREMLIGAASQTWAVDRAQCTAERGAVVHVPTGRRIGFGALAGLAASLDVPADPPLKEPKDFRLLGRRIPRLDIPAKVDGSAGYGLDVRLSGQLFAVVARCPMFGGRAASFDAASARSVPGVRDVVEISSGVAVVADGTWAAVKGREALNIQWTGGAPDLSSAGMSELLRSGTETSGDTVNSVGDAGAVLAAADQPDRTVEAVYEVPYLAHAAMEPINCTAHLAGGTCHVWVPTQAPVRAQRAVAETLGIKVSDVIVHTTLLGGGFGRRSVPAEVREAVELARATGKPIQVVWSREDDIRHDFYRQATAHRLTARLDDSGWPVAWRHRVVASHRSAVDGASEIPYKIGNFAAEFVKVESKIPLGIWRSVSHSYTAFAVECFIDELAARTGKDAIAFRRHLLADSPRDLAVLDAVAEKSGWSTPPRQGRYRGVALHPCFGSHVAQVAEISANPRGKMRVHRVTCAVDCGMIVNPDIIEAQIEGAIAFGLTAALYGQIRLDKGRVVESNFHDYRVLRFDEMPEVDVHILPTTHKPGGIGEVGVPPIAPAVANAVSAATNTRVRALPIQRAS
ncbi:MAG: xanthine dehydrogenase family protein molybdopterin-binding subunit [Proteobacteria bacterium]|nr:xanthine dehydrogenase family protein molybdopterin-binding subunit [Pseudomonadota bacterium]